MSIPRGSVRGVSFDYGHVLGGLDLTELAQRLHGASGPEWDHLVAPLRAAMPDGYRAHDDAIAAGLGHEVAWRALMRTLVVAAGVREPERAVEALWRAQPSRNLWRFVPEEARALLAELAAAGVPMVITSNSEGRVRELLAEVGIAHHFAAVLDSGVLGFGKPDARIFLAAARALGAPIEAMVHVGDSEAADVVGALAAGARAVRFDAFLPANRDRPTVADARAGTFDELRLILREALAL